MILRLRHSQPGFGRAPQGRGVLRGASRQVEREPLLARLPRPGFGALKYLLSTLAVVGAVAGVLVGAYEFGPEVLSYANRPIAKVVIEGDLVYADRQAVQQNISFFAERNFFDVDLVGMRHGLEQMPWIAHAEVRRVWPDQIVVHLDEQLPIARWGDEALLNNQGQTFKPAELKEYEHLPQLQGPQWAKQRIMQQYQTLSQMLRPVGFSITRLELRDRGSWFLSTGQGIELLLGRDHLVEKIRRFGTIYRQTLKQQSENIARIDLRYSNGLAVAWRGSVSGVAGAAASGKN
ncbi:cell division protein FtsQ/DivIB [Azomonas macrocytogenes]|uniref:Cell division protein FtsQ n=1 Tax=Azomonas macrocytogenes TaxID=69962 RepID=A0A839T529_AZOMA|nr:cell division protein FtsQ/DivIB [Azomonas macrocytogenes]MBB3104637.1 cell division protein FtsQ [Azomonas macrocytogenes]